MLLVYTYLTYCLRSNAPVNIPEKRIGDAAAAALARALKEMQNLEVLNLAGK